MSWSGMAEHEKKMVFGINVTVKVEEVESTGTGNTVTEKML
jgi:hypothetical protein